MTTERREFGEENKVDVEDLIKLQGVLRGYIERRKAKYLYLNKSSSKSVVH